MIVHSAGESIRSPPPSDTRAVVLTVPNLAALTALHLKINRAAIDHQAVFEPDPPYHGQLMAIGLKPQPRSALVSVRPTLSKLSLLR